MAAPKVELPKIEDLATIRDMSIKTADRLLSTQRIESIDEVTYAVDIVKVGSSSQTDLPNLAADKIPGFSGIKSLLGGTLAIRSKNKERLAKTV